MVTPLYILAITLKICGVNKIYKTFKNKTITVINNSSRYVKLEKKHSASLCQR